MRLGVTREDNQLLALKDKAKIKGIEVIGLPVIVTLPVRIDLPPELHATHIDWLFFTSANGVQHFFEQLPDLGITIGDQTKIAVVGGKTAVRLNSFGYVASYIPSEATGERLFTEWSEKFGEDASVTLFARAAVVNFEPDKIMSQLNSRYYSVVCYETKSQPVELQLVNRLSEQDFILFTAPSAVNSYFQQFGRPKARPIAIGSSTASSMRQQQWSDFVTMKQADIDTVLEYL